MTPSATSKMSWTVLAHLHHAPLLQQLTVEDYDLFGSWQLLFRRWTKRSRADDEDEGNDEDDDHDDDDDDDDDDNDDDDDDVDQDNPRSIAQHLMNHKTSVLNSFPQMS
ncbi:hypothetical protein V1477_004790 [Vespula maculifrons]|uniref:Uncharacterized protein n=1 Tax=Vespula maculifrons TaxID=7453 RepID=A0ABD2CMS9_VESMC